MRRSLAAAAACVVVVVCAPAIAVAQAPASVGFTFEPASASGAPTGRSYFDYSLAPGDAIQDYVRLANLTDHDRTFFIYGADGYTTAQGGFALRLRDQPRTAVGAWVSLPFTTRTVPAQSAITFPFQLGIPTDATPGDWAGGVVAVATDGTAVAPGAPASGVRIEEAVAARIYVRVQGPLHPALAVTRLDTKLSGGTWAPFGDHGRATVTYTVANSGNVRLAGTATVELTDAFGRVAKRLEPRQMPELLPRDTTTVTESFDGLPLTGFRYHANVLITAPGVRAAAGSAARWHVSVPATVLLLAVLVVSALGARRVMHRHQRRERSKVLVPA